MAKTKAKRAVLYLRVSTNGQTTANQRKRLEEVADHRGWNIVGVYEDAGISGAKGRNGRPEFDRLQTDATRARFDVVMAWSVDRIGRSMQDLVPFLEELHAANVDLYLDREGMDTTTPHGKAMFQMAGVFGELERSMVQERIKAGIERKRAEGFQWGRPRGHSKRVAKLAEEVHKLRAEGVSVRQTAKRLGVGVSTVQRILKERADA